MDTIANQKLGSKVGEDRRLRYMGRAVLILMPLAATISISPVFKRIMTIFIGVVAFDGSVPRYHVPFQITP
jgi:hypothetical protein